MRNTANETAAMLNRKTLFDDPFLVGFDRILDRMHTLNTKQTNYPPYNIIKTGEDTYLIEIAVAGFDEEDFDIELHDGVLTVRAEIDATEEKTDYLHRGIAARNFERKFTLADTIEVEGVSLHQGMLTINLQNVIPEHKKPRKIAIAKAEPQFLSED